MKPSINTVEKKRCDALQLSQVEIKVKEQPAFCNLKKYYRFT